MDDPLSNDIERIQCADDRPRDRVAGDNANSQNENGHLAPLVMDRLIRCLYCRDTERRCQRGQSKKSDNNAMVQSFDML